MLMVVFGVAGWVNYLQTGKVAKICGDSAPGLAPILTMTRSALRRHQVAPRGAMTSDDAAAGPSMGLHWATRLRCRYGTGIYV